MLLICYSLAARQQDKESRADWKAIVTTNVGVCWCMFIPLTMHMSAGYNKTYWYAWGHVRTRYSRATDCISVCTFAHFQRANGALLRHIDVKTKILNDHVRWISWQLVILLVSLPNRLNHWELFEHVSCSQIERRISVIVSVRTYVEADESYNTCYYPTLPIIRKCRN